MPAYWTALANHLWQSTLFAGTAALLAFVLRRDSARTRYLLWFATSLKFLIPASLLVGLGSQVEWRSLHAVVPPVAPAVAQIGRPFTVPDEVRVTETLAPEKPTLLCYLLIGIWAVGCGIACVRWGWLWRRMRISAKRSAPLPIGCPVEVRSSPGLLEPGVFGIWRPVILVPQGIADRLSPHQIQAVLAHEMCHVNRRDNLTSAIHMAVSAAFWFHPLVWWIGAKLVEEREVACDEEVLRQGCAPEIYAEGILKVCRFYLESPLTCASGVTGSNLEKRIEGIMTMRTVRAMSFTRRLLLASAGVLAVAGPVAVGIVEVPSLRAQVQPHGPLRFEVASIKPLKNEGAKGMLQILPGGVLRMEGTTLKSLISFSYDVPESRVVGGANWIGSEVYQLIAKPERSEAEDNPRGAIAPGTPAWSRMQQRLQNLLAERFQLATHTTEREVAGYALVAAKGGAKVTASPEGDQTPAGTMRNRGRIDGRNGTMVMLATVLSNMLGSPVVDRTGLTGNYTYKLEYSQDFGPVGPDTGPVEEGLPSIFVALQEQLGLKLESSRVTVPSIVIDRAERPSAN